MQYEASFPEDVPINTAILMVGATDLDSGVNAEFNILCLALALKIFTWMQILVFLYKLLLTFAFIL